MRPHGTRAKYSIEHCHCSDCRQANSRYESHRASARKLEEWGVKEPDMVPADETREHLLVLSRYGIGRRQVARLTGISPSTIQKIRHGQTKRVRFHTADVILGITVDQHARGRWPKA